MRADNRTHDQLRPIRFTRGWAKHAEGSCLIEVGDTKVLCTASIESSVPGWMRNTGTGWVTAEYGMLPRATGSRNQRAGSRPRPDGRTIEIQRLIGRSLRGAIDLKALGERSIVVDCDVLQADGGTRCASICGAWVALREAIGGLISDGLITEQPLKGNVAAVSVGIVGQDELLDLAYVEDSRATLDMNAIMTEGGRLIEVQAGGEGQTFSREELDRLLALAKIGIDQIIPLQNQAVKDLP